MHTNQDWKSKSNLILDKEQSDQGLFCKLIINNQIGLGLNEIYVWFLLHSSKI